MEILSENSYPDELSFRRYMGAESRPEVAKLERLSISSLNDEDIARIVEICNQPAVQKYVTYQYSTGKDREYTEEDANKFVSFGEKSWLESAPSYLIRNNQDIIMGTVGIKQSENGRAEIGYWADTTEGSSGYMTGAVLELCNLASREGLAQLYGYVAPDNEKSAALLTRSGFVREGIMQHTDALGETVEVDIYTKLLR